MGDTTAHGGLIVVGAPTVLIGGTPAARVGDQHTCPMVNPGTPPPPHVGGPIVMGSATVMICGAPAARMGDMCQCSGPPDSIVGGCPTVLIGDAGPAGAGTPGGGGSAAGEAGAEAETVETAEGHYLDVKFVDSAGLPISGVTYRIETPEGETVEGNLTGRIHLSDVPEGDYTIHLMTFTRVEWEKDSAREGEPVKMIAEGVGFPDDATAEFQVWERDLRRADRLRETITDVPVKDGKAEAEWRYQYWEDEDTDTGGYSQPSYYFVVRIGSCTARSGTLGYRDCIELQLNNDDGSPAADEPYEVYLPNGEVRRGRLDGDGSAKITNVPPGPWDVRFPERAVTDEEH